MTLFRDPLVAASQANALRTMLGPPMTTRLEPQVATGDPETGLQAQVWDPLWLLGRQWQVGEWVGEDTGTPLAVRVEADFEPFVAWHPGRTSGSTAPEEWLPLAPGELLGPLVEAEPAAASRSELATAGWALVEALLDLGQDRAAAALRVRFPAPDAPASAEDLVPDAWSGSAAVLAGRGIDAAAVAAALSAGLPPWWAAALRGGAARRAQADEALAQWLAWFGAEVQPVAGPSSWLPERLEYEFGLATGSTVLRAPAHAGGEVVWTDLELLPSGTPPAGAPVEPLAARMVAAPLTYPGMPASRFWEFEDAQIDLGSVWADPHELARLLVVEAALVTGGDWVVVPFDVPAGGIVRIRSVSYTDTFGSTWLVEPEEVEPGSWRMFEVTDADGATHVPGLVVPPPETTALAGPVLEDVGFLRDEGANLVWGIAHLAQGAGGRPAVPASGADAAPRRGVSPAAAEPVLMYSLMTGIPATWVPYLPRAAGPDGVALVRGRIPRFDRDCVPLAPPMIGTLLPAHPVLQSAEVPREGVRVRRVPMIARLGDGRWRSWTSRRVSPGRGEAESGLRYDQAPAPRPGG
jgi:hypothetical protein